MQVSFFIGGGEQGLAVALSGLVFVVQLRVALNSEQLLGHWCAGITCSCYHSWLLEDF